jgi:hypothetical protein
MSPMAGGAAAIGTGVARGFQITGTNVGDYTGASVAAGGDINNDGIDYAPHCYNNHCAIRASEVRCLIIGVSNW